MAEHEKQPRAETLRRVFNAAQRNRVNGIAGQANDKQISNRKPFAKNDFGRYASIRAAQHDDLRLMPSLVNLSALLLEVRVKEKVPVADPQFLQRVLLWIARLSGPRNQSLGQRDQKQRNNKNVISPEKPRRQIRFHGLSFFRMTIFMRDECSALRASLRRRAASRKRGIVMA